ncbi:mechanosensitive ion channel family protein [Phenylobacterium sp.]|uniref:mechanosensitive ion channel family protein n=1 Tax=Phenylobacterium sp. TaxID=1871053 RepID=UPI0025DBCBD5|nr:mechanosensitive ion channel family protein [Phenylobacterium sp.]
MGVHTFEDFWALVVDVWRHGYMGVAVSQIAMALLILGVAVLVRRVFSFAILGYLRALASRSKTDLDDAMVEALTPPARFVPIVIAAFVITQFVTPPPAVKTVLLQVDRSLVALTLFWAIYQVVQPLSSLLNGRSAAFNPAMVGWTVRVGRILVAALGGAAILEIWGIKVGPMLAGLGLFGVAVALGAQDLFKNLIGGIFVIAERRFQNGDWILAEGVVEGTVETIGLRTTKVRRFDMAPVFVPNAKLADNAITNFSQMTYRRISWMITLEYRTTTDQLRQIRDAIEAHILNDKAFVQPPKAPAFVRVDKFSDSSIDIMVYCFTRTIVWGEWLKVKETLAYAIKGIVEEAGAGFAFPSRSIYVETVPPGAEILPPPDGSAPAEPPAGDGET